jgi:hypothetical protein
VVSDAAATIARLEARVACLEKKITERSALIRSITREVCGDDLLTLTLFAAGLPPVPRASFGLRGWKETTALVPGDIESTMNELWRSVTPPVAVEEE